MQKSKSDDVEYKSLRDHGTYLFMTDFNNESIAPVIEFILEKSNKNLLLFQGNSFEFRTYVLIIQIDKKIYTDDNISRATEFMNEYADKIIKLMELVKKNNVNLFDEHDYYYLNNVDYIYIKEALNACNVIQVSNTKKFQKRYRWTRKEKKDLKKIKSPLDNL